MIERGLITVKNGYSFYIGGMPRVTEEHRVARRQQIVFAAIEVFAAKGFHKASMADIIVESGLSAGAVYLYFRSKDDLIVAVVETVLQVVTDNLDSFAEQKPPLSPAEILDGLIRRAVGAGPTSPAQSLPLLLSAWSESRNSPQIREAAHQWMNQIGRRVATLIGRWADAGHPLPMPAPDLARLMTATVQGYTLQLMVDDAPQLEEFLDATRTLFTLAGLGTEPSDSATN